MEPNNIIRQSSALVPTAASSLTLQESVLLSELDLTATNAKAVIEPRIGKEFLRVLAEFPAEAIEAAFRGWRDVSPFFPAISDIRELCMRWVRRQAEIREEQEKRKRLDEIAAARSRGDLLEWPDVVKKFNDIVTRESAARLTKKAVMPEVPDPLTDAELRDRREILRQQTEAIRKKYGRE